VVQLPRLPGARENRWAHTLSGEPAVETPAPQRQAPPDDLLDLKARVEQLETEVAELKALLKDSSRAN
jgi:uncharacterized protein YceH (UPF0502 family)